MLQSLELTGIDIGFSPGRPDYAVRVPSTTTSTVVTAAASTGATVTIDPADADTQTEGHQISLATGDNTVTVTVTEGADTTTYTAVITRTTFATLSDNADLATLAIADSDIGTCLTAPVTEYTANVPNSASSPTVTATSDDANAIITIDPADADTGTAGHQVSLAEGANTVTVAVEATDGTTKTYTITVNRASAADFGWSVLPDFKDLAAGNGTSRAIWSNGTTMWVTNLSGRLFAYDLSTMAPDPAKDIAALAGAGNRNANGLWSNGTTIWVSDDADDKIYAYDLATGDRQPDRDINNLGRANNNHAKGLWSNGTTMWVADHADNKIYAYDLATGARQRNRDINNLDDAGNQRAAGLWSDGTTMWVARRRRRQDLRLRPGHRRPPSRPGLRHAGRRGQPQPQGHLVQRRHHVGGRQRRRQDLRLQHARQRLAAIAEAHRHRRPPNQPENRKRACQ